MKIEVATRTVMSCFSCKMKNYPKFDLKENGDHINKD